MDFLELMHIEISPRYVVPFRWCPGVSDCRGERCIAPDTTFNLTLPPNYSNPEEYFGDRTHGFPSVTVKDGFLISDSRMWRKGNPQHESFLTSFKQIQEMISNWNCTPCSRFVFSLPTEIQWEYACRLAINRVLLKNYSSDANLGQAFEDILDGTPEWCGNFYAELSWNQPFHSPECGTYRVIRKFIKDGRDFHRERRLASDTSFCAGFRLIATPSKE